MKCGCVYTAAFAAVLLLGAPVGPVVLVDAAEPPLADAGLDQSVRTGTTVYLDATGSRDPDGRIVAYQWTVESPDGETVVPSCRNCARTTFVAAAAGRYAVTVAVSDDDGLTATDTLYVSVAPGSSPALRVTGPSPTWVGDEARYTAHATAGDAPLSTLVWRLDGAVVERDSISGAATTRRLSHSFGRAGEHTVSATVVDSDGQTASRSVETRVRVRHRVTGQYVPATARSDSVTTVSPTVRGPRLLIGSEPLRGTYRLTDGSGRWVHDGETAGHGDRATVDFEPGRHDLYAVTDGGVARFADGTSDVVADPEPEVTFAELDGNGSLLATAVATDGFANLVSLSLTVDGERVDSRNVTITEYLRSGGRTRLELDTEAVDLDQGTHTVVARARDARGQTSVVRKEVEVVGPPEIVRAEFVNDPVYAYDPRTDPERYTAHHVLVVDLNGVPAEDIEISSKVGGEDTVFLNVTKERTYSSENGQYIVKNTYWAKEIPGLGSAKFRVSVSGRTENFHRSAFFRVNPSNPIIRLNVDETGISNRPNQWGLIVDAGSSFDPDNTKLKFEWLDGAKPISDNKGRAKFNSRQFAGLVVRDHNGGVTQADRSFLDYYTPQIAGVVELTEGPYAPSESVRFGLWTEQFELSKNRYADDISHSLRVTGANATVVDWQRPDTEYAADTHSEDVEAFYHEISSRSGFVPSGLVYVGVFEVEAGSIDEHSKVIVYNRANPDSSVSRTLSVGEVLESNDSIQITDRTFLVEKPTFVHQSTSYPEIRDSLIADGYKVVRSTQTGTEWAIEERIEVEPAVFENSTQRFRHPHHREQFLRTHQDWSLGHRVVETEERTRVEYEWRDSRDGPGVFTGETRRIRTSPAEYQKLRQYRYEYTVERTGYRTEIRTRYVTDTMEYTTPVRKCNPVIGCYDSYTTQTREVTRRHDYPIRVSYTYEDEVTDTYWATSNRHRSHEYTGSTQIVEIEPAEFVTQYRFQRQTRYLETTTWYTATKRILLKPARHQWQPAWTTRNPLVLQEVEHSSNLRVGEKRSIQRWSLARHTGNTREGTSAENPESIGTVLKTAAVVGIRVSRVGSGSNATSVKHSEVVLNGYRTTEEIKSAANKSVVRKYRKLA